jgi:Tol biopolymer transport system component
MTPPRGTPAVALIVSSALLAFAPTSAVGSVSHDAAPLGVNGRIAFATEGAQSQIYTVNPDGTDQRELTHASNGVQVDMPDWSPDGSRIAYVSNTSGNYDVMVMNADGTGQYVLAHSAGWDYQQPRWSPDGSRFAVVRCNNSYGYCDLDTMRSDGTGRRLLVGSHVDNSDPSWSPDGSKIAFFSNRAGLIGAVWIVNSSGGGLRRLTRPAIEACSPSWSPLGNRILFTSDCDRPNPHTWVMNPDGTRARRLSPEPPNKAAAFGSYSPDGRHIVLISDVQVGFGADVYTMNANGTNFAPIVTDHRHVFWTDWGTSPTTDAASR